jgi:hypothetical protein
VQFRATSAQVSNITNRKDKISENNQMIVDMQTRLLNQFPLTIRWVFYLGDPNGRFDIHGKSGSANATVFNALSVPMAGVEFKTGNVNSMEFDLTGTNNKMNGTLKLLYTDFHLPT